MQETTNAIANRVRGVAAEKRATQQRIAEILGIARGSVNTRMNGTVPFTGAELLMLASAFDVEIQRFFPTVVPKAKGHAA